MTTFFDIKTPNEFREAIKPFSVKNPPCRIEWKVYDIVSNYSCQLHVLLTVPDRDSGLMVFITHPFTAPLGAGIDVEEWFFNCLMSAMRHELEECFHYQNVRIRDPHAKESERVMALYRDNI